MIAPANEQDVAVNTKDEKQPQAQANFFIPLDTSWFDREPERYLQREDFREFQEVSGVDFQRLMSTDRETVQKAQAELTSLSIILNEIQAAHFGFGFPFLVYTHDLNFSPPVPSHESETDKTLFALDMCDSLYPPNPHEKHGTSGSDHQDRCNLRAAGFCRRVSPGPGLHPFIRGRQADCFLVEHQHVL